MGYEFDLQADLEACITDGLGTRLNEFVLGYEIADDDTGDDAIIVMSVMLVPFRGAHDLRFGIRSKDAKKDWKVSAPDYSRDGVRKYIPSQNRPQVLVKVCEAAVVLANDVRPPKITMETTEPNLSAVALAKYDNIANSLNGCGYPLEDAFRHGTNYKNYWLFKRVLVETERKKR